MDNIITNPLEEELIEAPETPEDVAVLYTWANVHGGKYRDFSASRREYRAQQRHRLVEAQREAELAAAREREQAAALELKEARRVEAAATVDPRTKAEAEEARRRAEEIAERERLAAQRHVETAEELKRALAQAQQEMEEARKRAEEQAARYAEADARFRATQKQREEVPGEINDPYYYAGPLEPTAFAPGKGVRSSVPKRVSSESRIVASYYRERQEGASGEHRAYSPIRRDEVEGEEYGLFSSGHRERGSSSAHPVYRETQPPSVGESIETPEDTRERERPDELERLGHSHAEDQFDDNDDDGYYDRVPSGRPQHERTHAGRGSAESDLHIPPRVQQTRTGLDSGERRVVRSEDPQPGNRHTLDAPRRHRESSADIEARTIRAPRLAESQPAEFVDDHVQPPQPRRSARDTDAYRVPETLPELPPEAAQYAVSAARLSNLDRPEWLGRDESARRMESNGDTYDGEAGRDNGPSAYQHWDDLTAEAERSRLPRSRAVHNAAPEDDYRPLPPNRGTVRSRYATQSGRPDRHADQGGELTREMPARRQDQTFRAADGGLNLRPLPDRPSRELPVAKVPRPALRDEPEAPRSSQQQEANAGKTGFVDRRRFPRASSMDSEESRAAQRLERRRNSAAESAALPSYLSDRNARRPDPVQESHEGESSLQSAPMPQRRNPANDSPVAPRKPESAPKPSEPRADSPEPPSQRPATQAPADTLQQSRERVAARWFALKGLMNADAEPAEPQAARAKDLVAPALMVVSLSGGVGKTSLVATLGRALSSAGEKVLLADTTAHGLLPYYFGARELRPDVVRTFSPPPGSADAPVYMVNYETDRLNADEAGQAAMVDEIIRHARGTQRVLMDLNGGSAWLARRMARQQAAILVPIAPDMNSVLSIQAVERCFAGTTDGAGRTVLPFYVLNQFDASLPLHLDVREVLRQQLADRLLPIIIRRSPSVSEALAEGMTVVDYAPESPVTEDYIHLADWVRKLAAPATAGFRSIRWSER